MPRDATTGLFTRVANSFSEPVFGTEIDPDDAIATYDDWDAGLDMAHLVGPINTIIQPGLGTGLTITQTASGNPGSGGVPVQLNDIEIVSDEIDAGSQVNAVRIHHVRGGGAMTGLRTCLQGFGQLTSPSNVANTNHAYMGLQGVSHLVSGDNGTGGSEKGLALGLNASAAALVGATHVQGIHAVQADVYNGSASCLARHGVMVMQEQSDFQALTYDAAFGASGLAGSNILANFQNGILFSQMLGENPLAANATILKTLGACTITGGIDWSSYTFTGNQVTGVGWTVSSVGVTKTPAIATTAPTTQTANYVMLATDDSIIFNGGGSLQLTLLSASANPGRNVKVRTIAAQTVVSATANVIPLVGGGAGTGILAATAGKWAWLQSDGTNWQIMMGN